MSAVNDYPVLDGIAPSFADITCTLSATGAPLLDIKDIKSINTGTTVEVGVQKRGGRPYKRTTGEESSEASMVVYREAWQKMLRVLKANAPLRGNQRRVSMVHFGLNIQHTPQGSEESYEMRIKGCRLMGRAANGAEGTDADVVEVALNPMQIVDVIDGEEVAML